MTDQLKYFIGALGGCIYRKENVKVTALVKTEEIKDELNALQKQVDELQVYFEKAKEIMLDKDKELRTLRTSINAAVEEIESYAQPELVACLGRHEVIDIFRKHGLIPEKESDE